ncbi:hypothetical protein P7C71_g402, partial [Lecanoromycetidae sp. Uapishka_2]
MDKSCVAQAAYIEDYDEDDETTLPGTKQAASAIERSKSDLIVTKAIRDEFSDSGYSSHTAATLGSAESSLESKTGSNLPKASNNAAASKRKQTAADNKKPLSRRQSPDKPTLQRTQSRSHKEAVAQKAQNVAQARRSAAPLQPSIQPAGNTKARPKASVSIPPQAVRHAPPQGYQDVPILQPAQPRPRPPVSQAYRGRPMSFHGVIPETAYMQQPIYIQPSPSPRYSVAPTFPPPSYPPPQASYFPVAQPIPQPIPQPPEFYGPPPSPYEIQPRPRIQRWTSAQPPARPLSMSYPTSPPIIEYGHEPIYTTIAPKPRPPSRQPSHHEDLFPTLEEHDDDDYRRMPPPPPPPKPTMPSRPTIKKSATTSDARPAIHHRNGHESTAAQVGNRSPTKRTFKEHERMRPSLTKSTKTSGEKLHNTQDVERSMRRMSVESSAAKNRRRASVYGHESLADLEESVEGYIGSKGTGIPKSSIPIETLVKRKKTHTSSKSSETSSRKSDKSGKSKPSSRSGSDIKSRRQSSEAKSHGGDNDGLAMRFNASQGVNVEFRGNAAEGRKINLRQSRDGEGDMELNISARGRNAVPARPPARAKSTRRYSYVEGQGTKELERTRTSSRAPVPREKIEEDEPRREPVTIRERIITRIRRPSKGAYSVM